MKKIYLEFFRGISSVFILFWHFVFLAPTGHFTKFTSYWGTDALMMFYMLSGLVINLTESKKPKPAGAFLTNRFMRIYPQFVVGLLLAFVALLITHNPFPGLKETLGNFLMVSTMSDHMGYIVPSIASNLPVWSLSFEGAFYLLFALTIGRNQKKAIFCWLMMALIALPAYYLKTDKDGFTHIISVFAFSSIWLLGYYIYEYRNYFYADKYVALFGLGVLPLISRMHFIDNFYDPGKYLFMSIFAVPFFRYALQIPASGKQIKMIYLIVPHAVIAIAALIIQYMPLKNAIAYCTLPYVYMGFAYLVINSKFKAGALNFINKAGSVLGKYSYSLYITHFTVLFVVCRLVHSITLFVLICLPIVALIAYSLENWLQPAVLKYFKNRKQQVTENQSSSLAEQYLEKKLKKIQ